MFKFLIILCLMSLVYTQDDDTTVEPDPEPEPETTTNEPETTTNEPGPTPSPGVTCPPYDPDDKNPVYVPDPIYCGVFFECSAGSPFRFDCAPGTYFNIDTQICDFDVDCGDRSTTVSPPTTVTEESF